MFRLLISAAAFLLSFLINTFPATAADNAALDRFLSSAVKTYRIPGLAVAVVNDKGVVFTKGYGEAVPGTAVTPDTPFILGSTSKTFTALAVMQLARQGLIDIDAPVKRYLPEFALAEFTDQITVRHLLNLTSGLTDHCLSGPWLGGTDFKGELASVRNCVPKWTPGTHFDYCSTSYRILGLMIERVTGHPYARVVNDTVFSPLGMKNSHPGPIGVEGLATGHQELFGWAVPHPQEYRPGALSSGFIVSSANDLSRFLIEQLRAGQGESKILDRELVQSSWKTPAYDVKSAMGYGMGWVVMEKNGHHLILHGGSLENAQSFMLIDPARKTGFVILANEGGVLFQSTGFDAVRNGLLDYLDGKAPVAPTTNWIARIALVFFLAIAAIEIFRIVRAWRRKFAAKPIGWGYRVSAAFDVGFGLFLMFGFIPMMDTVMGGAHVDYHVLQNLMPEVCYTLYLFTASSLARGALKVYVIAKRAPS